MLLLSLPASAFKAIVPAFIAVALVLIIVQPRLSKLLAKHRPHGRDKPGPLVLLGVLLGGVYGGYFGAAQGIMVLAILTLSLDDELQRLNAVKVVLTGLVNLVSGIVFIFAAHVAWGAAGLIAGGSLAGRRDRGAHRAAPVPDRAPRRDRRGRDHGDRAAAGLTLSACRCPPGAPAR